MSRTAVVVCGSRGWGGGRHFATVASVVGTLPPGSVVIHGNCSGVDLMADESARAVGHGVEALAANWGRHGKAAGPIRNGVMLGRLCTLRAGGFGVAVIAFHNDPSLGRGTAHMVRIARAAGIPVAVYDAEGSRR
jgi:hypothetical protein